MLETRVSEYTKELFENWEATETKFDDSSKGLYMLKDPDSEYRKVCMFVDGYHCMIYGDYGSYVFDNMTWVATPHNLRYDDLGYQMEKMNRVSRDHAAYVFDSNLCDTQIIDWLKDRLDARYELNEEETSTVLNILEDIRHNLYYTDEDEIQMELSKYDLDDLGLEPLLYFTYEALRSSGDAREYTAFLNYHYDDLYEFDEPCECELWNAGMKLSERFLTSLYAMEVCSKKLKEKELDDIEEERDE